MSKMRIRNSVTGQVREIAVPARPKAKAKPAPAPTGGDKGKGGKSSAGKASG